MEKDLESSLRVRRSPHEALVFFMTLIPFIHYVLSGVMVVVGFILVLAIPSARKAAFKQRETVLIAACIVFVSTLSSLIAGNVIGLAIAFGVLCILLMGAYLRSVMTSALAKTAMYSVGCGGVFIFGMSLWQVLSRGNNVWRPVAWQYNANYLGSVAVLVALVAVNAFFTANAEKDGKASWKFDAEKLFFGAVFLLSCVTVLFTESRSSLLALCVSGVLFLFLKKQYILGGIAITGALGIWLLGYLRPDIFGWSNSLIEVFVQRWEIWKDALDIFFSSVCNMLIGNGPMTYRFTYLNGGTPVPHDHAHNILVDALVNVGVIGTALYILLAGCLVRQTAEKKRMGDGSGFVLALTALTAVAVQGIPDVTIMWHQTATLFVLVLSLKFKDENAKV